MWRISFSSKFDSSAATHVVVYGRSSYTRVCGTFLSPNFCMAVFAWIIFHPVICSVSSACPRLPDSTTGKNTIVVLSTRLVSANVMFLSPFLVFLRMGCLPAVTPAIAIFTCL